MMGRKFAALIIAVFAVTWSPWFSPILSAAENSPPTLFSFKGGGGTLSVSAVEEDFDPAQNSSHDRSGNEEDYVDDVDEKLKDVGDGSTLNFKVSELLKNVVDSRNQSTDGARQLKKILDFFETLSGKGKEGDKLSVLSSLFRADHIDPQTIVSSLRHMKGFLSHKFNKMISPGCLGDLLYWADTVLEYILAHNDLSSTCQNPLTSKIDCNCSQRAQETLDEAAWALDVIDSFGKFSSGITKGNGWFQGDFEQCTEISVFKRTTKHKWEGRYSRIDFYLYKDKLFSNFVEDDQKGMFSGIESGLNVVQLPSSLPECNVFFQAKCGVCFPKTCSQHDLETFVEYVVNIPQRWVGKRVICAADILYHDSPSLLSDPVALLVAFVILAIVVAALFGTCYDYKTRNEMDVYSSLNNDLDAKSKIGFQYVPDEASHPFFGKVLLCFSVPRNARKIFDMSPDSTKDHVKCLHGIRACSIIWVMYVHSYSSGLLYVDNAFDVMNMTKNIFNLLILNATLAVDTFFLMTGTLLAYVWLRKTAKTLGRYVFDLKMWCLFYVHRYIRLTPVYALVLFIQIFISKYSTDGPLWNPDGMEPKICRTAWWSNLAYVNNLVPANRMCMVWTWYLANDMQFFFLSPPLLILLWASGVVGAVFIGLLILATSLLRGFIVMSNDAYPPINILFNDLEKLHHVESFTSKVYLAPHCRCGPFLVGLLLGYVLFKYRTSIKIPKIVNWSIWVAMSSMGLAVLFGIYEFAKTGIMSDAGKFIYGSFGRVLWSVFVAWIILAGSTGHGGAINKLLSSKRWKPLSRLVYTTYLIHPTIMIIYYSSFMKPIHYEGNYQITFYFFGHIFWTVLASFSLSCLVEVPVFNLEILLLSPPKEVNAHQVKVDNGGLDNDASAVETISHPVVRSSTTDELLNKDSEVNDEQIEPETNLRTQL